MRQRSSSLFHPMGQITWYSHGGSLGQFPRTLPARGWTRPGSRVSVLWYFLTGTQATSFRSACSIICTT